MIFSTTRKVIIDGEERFFGDLYISARNWEEAERIASAITPKLSIVGKLVAVAFVGLNNEILFYVDFKTIQN